MSNTPEPKHCDDYIDDANQPKSLRRFLRFHRWPVHVQLRALKMGVKEPVLFARFKGIPVRIVMVSRLGDVGITKFLEREHGYEYRVAVEQLSHFTEVLK